MSSNRTSVQLIGADTPSTALANALLRQTGWSSEVLKEPSQCLHAKTCHWLQQPSLEHLRAALDDAIAVLEGSRHAFRSRDLAALRWRLLHLRERL